MTHAIHMDLDEGKTADIGCLGCHNEEAEIWMTSTYLVYALECSECGATIVEWGLA